MSESDTPDLDETPSAEELEAAGQSAMFGGEAASAEPKPAPVAPAKAGDQAGDQTGDSAQPYRVLARKYRPQTFSELIGQEPMVRTLGNAIERDRLAHAFLMTGVRGVGKTSTARLIAKALNCVGPDGQGGPTIDPCGQCEPCVAIAEGRHMDVIEMDAASHTGVDDVREIIEAVRYAAVSARYKIYIIDEVHMLSRNAFNALLKTLEEPPAHVKFLFATTEVDKLPVTVLSRTQRFDLRRISAPMLQDHFAKICKMEGVEAEAEALAMIANAAEGSVRDGLSILDQAIAHADLGGDGKVLADRVRDMLGLADKGGQRRLLTAMLEGEAPALLEEIHKQHSLGVEPLSLMRGVMDLVHKITVAQIGGSESDAPTQEERDAIQTWSERLKAAQLHRLWQLLMKGHDEVRGAPDPLVAAQMALLRVLHASDMPDPGSLVKQLKEMMATAPAPQASGEGAPAASAPQALDWRELVERIEYKFLGLGSRLRMQVRPITVERGKLAYSLADGFSDDFTSELRDALNQTTGDAWHVTLQDVAGEPTLVEREALERAEAIERLKNDPLVAATMAAFPGARLVDEDPRDAPDTNNAPPWSQSA
ncbi:DNA polymerase III subunit gamma/tau [Altererythrobacter sp. ZODW24]|uniref:DNA polymerase III subunit gamma/tau n=1 Tax=Altererythrobacter sp. ZODW24 TaxID=2185142 RepID=UPI000DF824A0|nr:DNA polymerase III subunit gamma/tau [Altererythrobacter sp. ZODW24]